MAKTSGCIEFFRAFWGDVLARMSGAISVPFAGIGLYWPEGRWLFFILAALCWFIAAYSLWKKEREKVIQVEAQLAAQLTAGGPFPDWPIRELIFHLAPDCLNNEQSLEKAKNEILDQFSIGKLGVWGNRFIRDNKRLPLKKIDREYWQDASLTMFFLEPNQDNWIHVRKKTGTLNMAIEENYSGLKVAKAEVMRIWPK